MKLNTLTKVLTIGIFLVPLTLGSIVHADDLKTLASLNLDTSIVTKDDNGYSMPTKIIIVPIQIQSGKTISFDSWTKGIFYYTISKLGFQDIPLHYLVSESGEVLKGNDSGDEKTISIDGLGTSAVVIGYLNNSKTDYINPDAATGIANLLINIANRDEISPDNISITGVNFIREKTTNSVTIQNIALAGNWQSSLSKIVDSIRAKYAPVPKSYSVSVEAVTPPSGEVAPGDEVTVSVKLKNIGNDGIYQGSNSELILTKNSGDSSNYYINGTWLSQTQTSIMAAGQGLLSGKEQGFEIKVRAPLVVGAYTESFILKNLDGTTITEDKNIDITLTVKDTGKQIIQIKPTGLGYVNVMADPNSSTVLRKISPGERYFLIDLDQDTLWAKIDLGDGTVGYIAAWQFTSL